jgi:hypothetical protein
MKKRVICRYCVYNLISPVVPNKQRKHLRISVFQYWESVAIPRMLNEIVPDLAFHPVIMSRMLPHKKLSLLLGDMGY